MLVTDYEKCVLSVMLNFPVGTEQIPQRICAELDADKFELKEHKLIYNTIQQMVFEKDVPTIPNIAKKLGANLDKAGGEEYLFTLHNFLKVMKLNSSHGFEEWVRLVDNAGRLRHLGLVLNEYGAYYNDFEKLVAKTADVDEFLANFMTVINSGVKNTRSSYKHISSAIEEERRRIELEKQGFIIDLIPCGWPNIEKYFIPRPSSYGVIAGLSSMGKTQFALQLMLGAAIHLYELNLPGCVAINELESVGWRLNRRLACSLAGIDSNDLAGGNLSKDALHRYMNILDYIDQLPIYYDDNPNITSTQLNWQAMALHIEKGPRVLGVSDYLELFADKGENEELRISNVVRTNRKICWETGSCEVAISQFNNSVLSSTTKIGGIGKARYSGAVGQAADWFLEVYNPIQMRKANIDFTLPDGLTDENKAYAFIEKNKDHSLGVEAFEWIPEFTRFRDIGLPMGQIYRKPQLSQMSQNDF